MIEIATVMIINSMPSFGKKQPIKAIFKKESDGRYVRIPDPANPGEWISKFIRE